MAALSRDLVFAFADILNLIPCTFEREPALPCGMRNSDKAIRANDYRDFIRATVEHLRKTQGATLAGISRKAGFASRGFLGDLICGRRRLTALSFARLKKGLMLSGFRAQLFEYLVALEERDVNFNNLSVDDLWRRISKLKLKLEMQSSARLSSSHGEIDLDNLLFRPEVYAVYASLGTQEHGASLLEITRRARLDVLSCRDLIMKMVHIGFVQQREDHYFASRSIAEIFDLGKKESFRRMYSALVHDLQLRTTRTLNSEQEYFYCGALSVNGKRLPEFKARLRDLISEFLDDIQDDKGDLIAKIVLGFYLNEK